MPTPAADDSPPVRSEGSAPCALHRWTGHYGPPVTEPQSRPVLRCPLCQGTQFEQQESRQDSLWGFTSHVMLLMICTGCNHVLHFSGGNSLFDFD